jgi:hypothetical protein
MNLKLDSLEISTVVTITARHSAITSIAIGVIPVVLDDTFVFGWSFISISPICSFAWMYLIEDP